MPDEQHTWNDGPPPAGDPYTLENLDPMLVASEAANAFDVNYRELMTLVKAGVVPSKKVGPYYLLETEPTIAYLRDNPRIKSRFREEQN